MTSKHEHECPNVHVRVRYLFAKCIPSLIQAQDEKRPRRLSSLNDEIKTLIAL